MFGAQILQNSGSAVKYQSTLFQSKANYVKDGFVENFYKF